MSNLFLRTQALVGPEGLARLQNAHITVVGVGGVGGSALEALVRSGIGRITAIDGDTLSETNCNRQLLALSSTVGQPKVAVAAERMKDINPALQFTARQDWLREETIEQLIPKDTAFVADCIDDAAAKLVLAEYCRRNGIPLLMCMGTGNRLTAAGLQVTNFDKTAVCPLAKKMRLALKNARFRKLRCLYSTDPVVPAFPIEDGGKRTVGSIAFVPPMAGMRMAEHIVNRLLADETDLDIPK
ncbi:MAG: tRNA threonylcarbamoyladenosine dehydratase [Clostridia bacterium]|nr:tRNA threonylcarbamoyladenosine dehydratase [Clostridia bacterium]